MPVLDNGTTFPGPIPYALHTRKLSFLYSMLEIALTPSSFALSGRGKVGGIANVSWTPGIPPEDNIAATISRPVSMLLPAFKWIFICDLIEAAFRSQAPLPPCGSERSMR